MKFVFPESVERELAEQVKKANQNVKPTSNSEMTSNTPITAESIESKLSTLSNEQMLQKQRDYEKKVQQVTSKLYTPQSPLTPEYRSKSAEIDERLQRIQKRFDSLKAKEEAKIKQLQREAWLKYSYLSKPTLSDFKRPLTSFFLCASAVYMTMQYAWYAMEYDEYVHDKETQQNELVARLNQNLKDQQNVINDYENSSKKSKWWFW